MAGIRKWIRRKLHSKPKGKEEQPMHQDPLPFLPAERPRQLTPTSPHESEDLGHPSSLQNCGLFGRVPYELRRQILLEAFGGRTLHVDLSWGHPLARRASQNGSKLTSSTSAPPAEQAQRHCGLGSELVPDTDRPKGWQWFSCVCHRRAGYSEVELEQRYAANEFSRSIEPCDDQCLEGSESMCSCGKGPNGGADACFVGVMGWLLACRQAYSDTIDILYSTNTFHISSLDLQLNLPRLLPRQHSAKVTSLELLWKLNTIDTSKAPVKDHVKPLWDNGPNSQNQIDSPLHTLCAMIPETFPHLRSLYVSFQSWLDPGFPRGGPGGDTISEMETTFLGPVEHMLRACLGPSTRGHGHGEKEFNMAIQRGAWRVLLAKYHKLLGPKLKVESVDELSRGRFWKPLGSGSGHTDSNGTSHVDHENEDGGFGYWICGGWEDMKAMGPDYWILTHWGDKWTGTKETY